MTNTNCLENIACPKCGNDAMLYIDVAVLASVTDNGAQKFGDTDWTDDSFTQCPDCGHTGTFGDFRTSTTAQHSTPTAKE